MSKPVETAAEIRKKADAKLISAAPALLASLMELVNSPNAKENAAWDRARAAVSAATLTTDE